MNSPVDSLQEILYSLSQNKLRTFLTGFGVFWGIFMLILLLGAGQGLRNGVESNFTVDAKNSVWITSRKTSIPYNGQGVGRKIHLTTHDVQAIQDEVSGVGLSSAEKQTNATIRYGKLSQNCPVLGVADSYFRIKIGQQYHGGRRLNAFDNREKRKVAVIGSIVANTLMGDANPVGKDITINAIQFTVVGTFYDSGNNGRMSERIYIPLSIYQATYGKGEERLGVITYVPKPTADPWKTEEDVMALLRKRHNISPEDNAAIRSNNLLNNSKWVNGLFGAINTFIWFVGIGTLMAGIVGISNIMMITVKERTMEIGVRKALGATPLQIVSTLLLESVLVTVIAGYLGLAAAVGLLEAVNNIGTTLQLNMPYFQRPEVDFSAAIIAIGILVGVGGLAGFAPAWRAARIAPVEAMREQ